MKWIKQVCVTGLFSLWAGGALAANPAIEKPVMLDEAMLSITVSDMHGLLDEIGLVAAQVSPMMNGMMLKSMAGSQLGDPGLTGIAPGKGLAIVALDATNFFAVIEVSEPQAAAYSNAVASLGMQSEYRAGLLVTAQTAPQLEKGIALAEKVESTLLAKRSSAVRIALQPVAIIERNNEQIQGMLQMMPMMMGQSMMQAPGATLDSTQTTLKLLEGELRVFISLAQQCELAEVVLAPQGGSVRITETFVPKAGTRLDTLCNAPTLNQPNPKINAGYLGDGAIRIDATLANPQALMDFTMGETEQLVADMEITDLDLVALVSVKDSFWEVSGGSISEVVSLNGESGLTVGYLMDVKDEAKALDVIKELSQELEPVLELYEQLGISMEQSFKENVREHDGVNIHQFMIGISMTNQPPETMAQLEAMNLTNIVYDVAITDGVMIMTMGEQKVEAIMARLNDEIFSPAPLAAHSVYPAGGFYYFDFDVGEYMAFVDSIMPDAGVEMGTLLQGVDPITSAGYKTDGRVMWSVNVPGDLIAKLGQMAMMKQMQSMQQPQGGMQ